MEQRMRAHDGALETSRFANPEEELRYLRERVRIQHETIGTPDNMLERGRVASRELATYADVPATRVLHETYVMPEHETLRTALKLEVESHDAQMDGLLTVLSERGVRNALSVASRLGSAHLEDDFHRMLVRYIAEGLPVKHLPRSTVLRAALSKTLFHIQPQGFGNRDGNVKEALASSEQLYVGLLGLLAKHESFSLEIAVPEGTEAASLYVAVPKARSAIAERLIASVFPGARINELRGDYNIFVEGGFHTGAVGTLAKHPAFPFKTYESFEHDPLSVILAAFAKISKHGEGAALQIVVSPSGEKYNKHYQKIIRALEKGESVQKALRTPETAFGEVVHMIVRDIFSSSKKKGSAPDEPKITDTRAIEALARKVESRIAPVNIRIITSAQAASRAHELVQNLSAPFAQFDDPMSNHVVFKEFSGHALRSLIDAFIYRTADASFAVPLNMAEITSLMHFTAEYVESSRELQTAHGKEAPAPVTMPVDGVVLGLNRYGASVSQVRFGVQDRLRHCYVIGQTGTGKTTMIKNMIIQDIRNGEGVGFIDPHGNDIEDILAAIPPSRMQDVIYFDPAYTKRPMGLNILEYDKARPELKTLITDELYMIFRKLYSDLPEAFGPMFEQYYRNATMLVLDDPNGHATLADIPRVFADREFRRSLIARCTNPIVVQFWSKIAEQSDGEASLGNIAPYITAKFDAFLSNEIMRPIVCQPQSSFNFREIMDGKKIFLANLSKGRLGERNMALLGLVLVSKFAQAAFSRAESRGQELPPFYLYIDEFQNFTTPSIASILSEARKYKLSLTIAHQFLDQLTDEIRSAVMGNVGTKMFFRVGAADSEFLEKQVAPTFSRQDLEQLENYHAIAALLVGGMPATPFSMTTEKPETADASRIDATKELSYRTFGRERADVESDVRARLSSAITSSAITTPHS